MIDDKKNRIPCSHPCESYQIAKVLKINEDDIFGFPYIPIQNKKALKLINERGGFETDMLCFGCLAEVRIDLERDPHECPKCKHKEIIPIQDLYSMQCPKCKQGVFFEVLTGIIS
ncbi:MAG: hypothetical protein KKC46_11975 [Proteobacteria bacterium]|nr:hypothetical protein [Pseudomonadota bacterium]